VAYAHAMPGKTDLATVLEMNYLNTGFMLEFETNNLEVHIAGINDALVPGDVYNFTKNAMSIEAQGTETSSLRNFVTTVTFSVKIKAGASDGPCELRFIKVGSLATDSTDWADDCTWNKSMTFAVTRRAEHAYFKEDALATAIITNNGQRAGKFEVNAKRQDATIYVQNLAFDQRFDSLFSVLDLVTADASFTAAVTKISLPTGSVFLRISDNPNNAEYNKLKFRGVACSATVAQALAEITVYAAGGKPLSEGLTVSVYVIDAAKSFATIQSGAVRYYGNNPTNSSATISPYDVKIVRQFAENPTMYEFDSDDVHLYLGHSTDPSAELHPETRSGAIYFSHGEREIFSYSLSSGALTPLVDLYTYAYNYNQSHDTAPINVSSVLFEIKIGADEFYIGDPPSLKVSCLFERYADGLAIFTDEACTNKISGSYAVNQGELVHLYVSSTVMIQDEEIIVNNFPGVTTVQRSFIVINSQDTALLNNVTLSSSALVDGEENQFYYVTFHAPRVSGTGNTNDYVLSLQGGDSASLMLTVQNFARGVSRISLCNDQDGATAIDDAVLNFGGFINGDIFERTIYIKVEYV
ncbi:MAG: hypothetical protein J1G04_07425, partial [Clostridiales bacterium]|nr:hypothetical protein [Clostridiales bacterium]